MNDGAVKTLHGPRFLFRACESLKNPVCGTLLAFFAALLFASMGLCIKKAGGGVPAFWVVSVRSLVGALLLLPFVLPHVTILRKKGAFTLWLRGFAGSASSFFYFWNIQHSSIGDAGVLLNLSPVMVAGLSYCFLKETLRPMQIAGIIVSLVGLSAVGFNADSRLSVPVFLSGICGAVLTAIAFTALRRAANAFSSRLVVWTYMVCGLFLTLIAGGRPLCAWMIQSITSGGSNQAFLWAVGSGICGLFAQMLFTLTFLSLEAAVATTLSLTSVLWGTLLEMCFDGRSLGLSTWLSYAVVLSGAALLQWSTLKGAAKRREVRLSAPAPAAG